MTVITDTNPLPVKSFNVYGKFREAFEDFTPGAIWTETEASGDIIALDGNSLGASYLVISKDPLSAGSVSQVETVSAFDMPFDLAAGLHMSQRTLGQEFSFELVSTEAPLTAFTDLAISSISQATTTLTVNTTNPHGLKPGMRIGIFGVSDSRFNYPSLVVATIPTANQFTATAGPGGTIPSVTAGPLTSGFVYLRSAMGYAPNGTSMIFEQANAAQASFYVKSKGGDNHVGGGTVGGNHSVTLLTTASIQAINAANTYAFQPTDEYRLAMMADRIQWSDAPVDTLAAANARVTRTQVIPDPEKKYKLRVRATNNKGLTVPNARIVSVTKSGTTTATVVTDVPHGFTTGDVITAYGVRDQTNFANLTAATAVASIVDATTFTVIWGSAVTATSYGGFVSRVQGNNLNSALGAIAQAISTATVASGILTLVGSAAWSGLLIGDYVNVHGAAVDGTGVSLGIDGAWRVRNIVTTSLELEPIGTTVAPANFGPTNGGGAIIKRTDLRISFIRIFNFARERVEFLQRPNGDEAGAAPVRIQGTPAVTMTSTGVSGTVAVDAAMPNPVAVGGRASNANIAAMSATGDLVAQLMTMIGAAIMKPYALPEAGWNGSAALTTTTAVAIKAAAAAGLKNHITALQAINTGAATTELIILDGATERWRLTLPVNVPVTFEFPTELVTTAATALNVNLSVAGTVRVNAQGYVAP